MDFPVWEERKIRNAPIEEGKGPALVPFHVRARERENDRL